MEALLPATNAAGFPWANPALHAEAIATARSLGLPGRKTEAWMYTPVAKPIGAHSWTPAAPQMADPGTVPTIEGLPRLVFVNGRLDRMLSDAIASSDLTVASLATLGDATVAGEHYGRLASKDAPFVALNTAHAQDGLAILLPRGTELDALHLVHLTTASEGQAHLSTPRVLVVTGEGSRVTLVEEHITQGDGRTLSAAVTEIVVGPNAQVDHLQLFTQGLQAIHLGHLAVEVGRDGRFTHQHLSLGGAITRAETELTFVGPGAEATLNGLFAPAGEQVQDHHLTVRHAVPHCTSNQLFKGALAGEGRGVFTGQVQVAPGARQSTVEQSNPNLLLTPGARVYTRPQLVIDNDDVVASHGATVGRLDAEALFYLQTRGLAMPDAERLLTAAFAGEIIEALPYEDLRERVRADVNARLFGAQSMGDPA
jgi:Fe-S cluster assembly protein SufD